MNSLTQPSPTKTGKPNKAASPLSIAGKNILQSPYASHLRRERSEDPKHDKPFGGLQIVIIKIDSLFLSI